VRSRTLVLAAIGGLGWGAVATVLVLAMFRGLVPAVSELPLPAAIVAFFAVLPFQSANAVEVLLGRSSPGLFEIVGLTVGCGVVLGLIGGVAIDAAREPR